MSWARKPEGTRKEHLDQNAIYSHLRLSGMPSVLYSKQQSCVLIGWPHKETSKDHHLDSNPTGWEKLNPKIHTSTLWERQDKITVLFILSTGLGHCSVCVLQMLQGLPGHLQRCSSLVTSLYVMYHHYLQPQKLLAGTFATVFCALGRKPLLIQIGLDASFLQTICSCLPQRSSFWFSGHRFYVSCTPCVCILKAWH